LLDPLNTLNTLEHACQLTLELATAQGAEAFVSVSHGIQSKIAFEKNDYNLATHHDGINISMSLHKDQKSGSVTINTFDHRTIEAAVSRCLELSKFSIPDPYLGLAPKADYIDLPMFFDQSIVNKSMKELKDLTTLLIDLSTQDSRVLLDAAHVEKSISFRVIGNTRGMFARDYNASLNWFLMGMAKTKDDLTSIEYHGDFAHNTLSLERDIAHTCEQFKHKVLAYLNAKTGESYHGLVLLPPCLTEEFILDPVIFHLKGGNIMDGKSRWEHKLNQPITHVNLNIEDHPHDTELRGCTAFSGEGIATKTMSIVTHGVAKAEFDSVYTANRRKTQPSGNGSGPHSAVIAAGKQSWKKMIDLDQPIIIPARFSGNLDPLSGDFSGIAKGAQLYKNGVHHGCLKETMIAGNVFDMLTNCPTFSSERESDFGYHRLPYALVDNVAITSS